LKSCQGSPQANREESILRREDVLPEEQFNVDKLTVKIYDNRHLMGTAAAAQVSEFMSDVLKQRERVNIVFAAAPSQEEFLAALRSTPNLDWSRVNALHLDEYLGLPSDAPQAFGRFLKDRLFDWVHPGKVYYLRGNSTDPSIECQRYSRLIIEHPLDIACIGIGENGHIAFNDPHVANFEDPVLVKEVHLDEKCRLQQVHDVCFPSLDLVPTHALTMTIPAIMSARHIYCIVPGPRKREAVKRALEGPIEAACPASVLRMHPCAVLFLDREAASDLEQVRLRR